jgi:toxin FitB
MATPSKLSAPEHQGITPWNRTTLRYSSSEKDPLEAPSAYRLYPSGFQVIRFLLDTNVISEVRKVRPHGGVIAWLETLRTEQIFLSAVTIGELQIGVELTRRQDPAKARELESWLISVEMSFACVPMDSTCFREWSRMMCGKPDAIREDAMIAATARVKEFTVATRDEKGFRHLGVEILNPFKFH